MKKMIFLKVKNSYNKKLVTWLDLNLQVAHLYHINILNETHRLLTNIKFHFLRLLYLPFLSPI